MWCRISNADDWTEFIGVPLLGVILHGRRSTHALLITALSDIPEDRRDENSYYACLCIRHKVAGVFAFDVADDGLLVQIVKNLDTGSPQAAAGWCASCSLPCILLPRVKRSQLPHAVDSGAVGLLDWFCWWCVQPSAIGLANSFNVVWH